MPDADAALRHLRAARESLERAEAALSSEDPAADRVLAAVAGETTLATIRRLTGLARAVAAQTCSRLVKRGLLRRVRQGVYAPPKGSAGGSAS